jgi:hypothetical protein
MGDFKVRFGNQPKSNKMKKKELQKKKFHTEQQQVAPAPVVHVLKTKVRNLSKVIEEIFSGIKCDYGETRIQNIKSVIKDNKTEGLKRILLHFVEQKVDFAEKAYGHREIKTPLNALVNISKHLEKAIRPIEDWESSSHNTSRCIASFSRHLFGKYYIPSFMDEVWNGSICHQNWFIHIGQGQNIRTAIGLPVPLTKREAHFFMKAPKDMGPLNAIRYGQIANMGGNEAFVRQILKTRIANDYDVERNKFYQSVFVWLMANPMLDTCHYAPILDYIHNQKYVGYRLNEQGMMVPRQPNFCMKNRDPESLLKQVELWHKQVGKESRGNNFPEWAACGRKGLYHKSGDNLHTIREICTQKELVEEGRKMHHCAGSYASSCARGEISIWSYEVMDSTGIEKILTLEVNNREGILRQARGKYNALPTAGNLHFVKLWVREAGLSISKYMF